MTCRWLVAALLPLLACDALVETPAAPRAHFVRPVQGGEFREVNLLTLEVALDNCQVVDSFDVFADGNLLLRVDRNVDLERVMWDCPNQPGCVSLWPSDLMSGGVLSPVEIHADVRCAGADFSAATEPLVVAVSPFTGSVVLGQSADVVLQALPGGLVAAQTSDTLSLIDGAADRVIASRSGAGRVFSVGTQLFQVTECSGVGCGTAGQLTRLSVVDLAPVAGPVAIDCSPAEIVVGPYMDTVTAIGGAASVCWQIYDSSLQHLASGTHARVGLAGARRRGTAVRMLATDGAAQPALYQLDITEAGITETSLSVTLMEPTAAALSDDASWALASVAGGLTRIELASGTASAIAVSGEFDAAGTNTYEPVPQSDSIMAWTEGGLLSTDGRGTRRFGGEVGLAFAIPDAIATVSDARVINVIKALNVDSRKYGPLPDDWQLRGHAAARDGWFHIAIDTSFGLIVGSINSQGQSQ